MAALDRTDEVVAGERNTPNPFDHRVISVVLRC
jgi:hypothetical protein